MNIVPVLKTLRRSTEIIRNSQRTRGKMKVKKALLAY